MHKPLRRLFEKDIYVETPRKAMLEENRMTLRYMEIFDWEVWGGQRLPREAKHD